MPGRLAGKTALITGATGGIGRATAELFAREGARLVVTDTSADAAADLAARLESSGVEAVGIGLDVSSAQQWSEAIALVKQHFGGLDVLVNIAGVVDWPGIEDTDPQAWDRVIAV